MKCEGLHCPGCGHGGAAGAFGGLALAAIGAVVAYEVVAALLWAIVVTVALAVPAVVVAGVLISRRMNAPVPLTRYRPGPVLEQAAPRAAVDAARLAELEARLRDAEVNARAALLAADIIARQTPPLPYSGTYSGAQRGALPR